MRIEVYDIECMLNLFTYTGYDRTADKWFRFVIHPLRNDLKLLINHLSDKELAAMIGFNNLSYDYPMIHHILNHAEEYLKLEPHQVTDKLYQKSQSIIDSEYSVIADKNTYIPQIDVFKINHWDNPAKATSLKHCEMAMRMDNIEEMPIPHWKSVKTLEEIQMILDYNEHDVLATNMVFDYCLGKTEHSVYKGKNKITLRQELSRFYNTNLINFNDVRMGETLVFKLYAKKVGIPEQYLKGAKTLRPKIELNRCVPSYIKFNDPKFIELLNYFKNTVISGTKKPFEKSVIFNEIKIDYGVGGVHASCSGVFKSDDEYVIVDSDVGLTLALLKSLINCGDEKTKAVKLSIPKISDTKCCRNVNMAKGNA